MLAAAVRGACRAARNARSASAALVEGALDKKEAPEGAPLNCILTATIRSTSYYRNQENCQMMQEYFIRRAAPHEVANVKAELLPGNVWFALGRNYPNGKQGGILIQNPATDEPRINRANADPKMCERIYWHFAMLPATLKMYEDARAAAA
jgi:hypothetical protein